MTAPDSARIDGLYELAFRRHQAGQLSEAEALYRGILDADPRQLDCLHLLGMIALQSGRPAQAVELIGQAIAANDGVAAWHGSLAEALRALGERDRAIAHYRKAVALDPKYWAAHNVLAELLRDTDPQAAIDCYQKAIAAKPDLAGARHNLAALLLEQGRPEDATDAIWRALASESTEAARALFVECVRNARKLPGDPGFRAVLTRAVTEIWGRPVDLAGAALTLVRTDAGVRGAIRQIDGVWPRRIDPSVLTPAMPALTQDALLHRVMETTPVRDEGLERLLASTRTVLLDAALDPSGDIAPEMLPLCAALARQCFINEYVFHLPDVEQDGMVALRGKLMSDLSGTTPVHALTLLCYACYAPLHTLDRAAAIRRREWPQAVRDVIDQQVNEPEEEARHRAALPRLSPITDETSVRVRQQYEENPYPRWVRSMPMQPAPGIAAFLRAAFPRAPVTDIAEPASPRILIAGCGTGQQPIDAARRFPRAHVLAIDLSRASLGYARRKATELGVANLEFGQADIMSFEPEHRFDYIEASGVLHHLADPMQGWSRVTQWLEPGGAMRVGLYSEMARQDVVLAREFIAGGGYDASPESIRAFRQNLAKIRDPRLRDLFGSPDFYSISACRDLLFHVQEHRLTLPQIAAFLAEQHLTFLGFELGSRTAAEYRARFPADDAMTDLGQWHRFETENPDIFAGMYNFCVQKA
jgi:tetratricopeptide (TPR) repeat protein/SAM-dependent methyltransferase